MSFSRSPLALLAAAPGLFGAASYADVITDGSAGALLNVPGPNFLIPETLGTINGANLFHSFQEFDIAAGQSATFTGPAGLDNVISRVTGGTSSEINGALNSTIPGADFYFINPAGVTFGGGASVNVPAGFHVSTADKLNFSNGDVLLSAGGAGSTFSSAPVADFGFLGARVGDIIFVAAVDFAPVAIFTSGAVSLTARDVTLAPDSEVRLLAPGVDQPSASLLVDADRFLETTNAKLIGRTRNAPGGDLVFKVTSFEMDGAFQIKAESLGTGGSGDIVVDAQSVSIQNSLEVRTRGSGSGASGDLSITASTIDVTGTRISTTSLPIWNNLGAAFDPGASGALTLIANSATLRGAVIETVSSVPIFNSGPGLIPAGQLRVGPAGPITIMASDLLMLGSDITSQTAGRGTASFQVDYSTVVALGEIPPIPASGNITIAATNSITLAEGSSISSQGNLGDSGDVSVTTPNLSLIGGSHFQDGAFLGSTHTRAAASTITTGVIERGTAGNIDINVGTLTLQNGGLIASTTGARIAGEDLIDLGPAGAGGAITVNAGSVSASGFIDEFTDFPDPTTDFDGPVIFSGIQADSLIGGGPGGSVTVNANTLNLSAGGNISATSVAGGGDAGDITLNIVGLLDIVGPGIPGETDTGIFATADGSAVNAGSIHITADELRMSGLSRVRSDGLNSGFAGAVTVDARLISLSDDSPNPGELGTHIGSRGGGPLASINIHADIVDILNGASITSELVPFDGADSGDGGDIIIVATSRIGLTGGGQAAPSAITAGTTGGAVHNAGSVSLAAPAIELTDGGITSLVALNTLGAAGNITINASDHLTLLRSGFVSSTSGAGAAGGISVTTPSFISTDSLVFSGAGSNATGAGGNIAITAGTLQVSGATVPFGNLLTSTGIAGVTPGVFASSAGAGSAGGIVVNAGDFDLFGGSNFSVTTTGGGAGGSIAVTSDTLSLETGSAILATASGGGNAGSITLNIAGLLNIDARGSGLFSTANGAGQAGAINVAAGQLTMTNVAKIQADGFDGAFAGAVNVSAGLINLSGNDGDDGTAIQSKGGGPNSSVTVTGSEIRLLDGARISSNVERGVVLGLSDRDSGDGGDVTVNASTLLLLENNSLINAGADEDTVHNSGDVFITAPSVSFVDAAAASFVGVRSLGAAGSVTINAANSASFLRSAVASSTDGAGNAGNVSINAPIIASDQSYLVSGSSDVASGDGGNITLTGDVITISGHDLPAIFANSGINADNGFGGVSATTAGGGPAGDIFLTATTSILLDDTQVIALSEAEAGPLAQAGNIWLTAPAVDISGSAVAAVTSSAASAGGIHISASDTLTIANQSLVSSQTLAAGNSAAVEITAGALNISGSGASKNWLAAAAEPSLGFAIAPAGSGIAASAAGPTTTGRAGSISIHADTLTLTGDDIDTLGAFIASTAGDAAGGSGNINLQIGTSVTLTDATMSVESEAPIGTPSGGIIVAAPSLHTSGGSEITTTGFGTAGRIELNVTDIVLDGLGRGGVGPITSGGGGPNAGVFITGRSLSLLNGAQISTESEGGGATAPAAGPININAIGFVSLADGASIRSNSDAGGNAGNVNITTPTLTLEGGSTVLTNAEISSTFLGTSAGGAGDIVISATTVNINGVADDGSGGREHSNIGAFASQGAGQAGDVTITASALNLLAGGQITAFSNNQLAGGVVTIEAAEVTISGSGDAALAGLPAIYGIGTQVTGVGLNSALIADAFSTGAAGTIIVKAQNIRFLDGGLARASTSAAGRGGTIIICADGTIIVEGIGSALLSNSSAASSGDAGRIGVQADSVSLSRGGRVTVASAGTGQGGQIVMQAHDFDMTNVGGSANPDEATAINTLVTGAAGAASVQGAGQVTVFAGDMNIAGGSVVTTDSSGAAPAGRIVLRAGTLNIEGASTLVSSAAEGANQGSAGVIDIGAYNLELNGATISTLSESGSGGQIRLAVDNHVLLVNGEITTQVHGTTTDSSAGDIYIGVKAGVPSFSNPCEGVCVGGFDPFLGVTRPNPDDGIPETFVNEATFIKASAEVGSGGSIDIVAVSRIDNGTVLADPDSFYDVSSVSGVDGVTRVQGLAFGLPNFVFVADNDYHSMCEAQQRGQERQFVEAFRQAPPDPTSMQFAPYQQATPSPVAALESPATCAAEAPAQLWQPHPLWQPQRLWSPRSDGQ